MSQTGPGQGVGRRNGCPVSSMYCRDGGTASSCYYKADRSSDSGITSSFSPALEVERRGENKEKVWAYLTPLLLISLHMMKWEGNFAYLPWARDDHVPALVTMLYNDKRLRKGSGR